MKEAIKTFVIQTLAMNLSDKESLSYLSKKGYDVSRSYLTRIKKDIRESDSSRLSNIARKEFVSQHLQRIDTLNIIQQELWSLYRIEKNTYKKAMILKELRELQQYISSFYDASMYVYEKSMSLSSTNEQATNKKRKKIAI